MYKASFLPAYVKTAVLSALVLLVNIGFVGAQYQPKYADSKQIRDTVLMNTDHFYLGGELGLGFNLGPTATLMPGVQMETNYAPFEMYDFSLFTPTKLYAGYAYKSHHFEGSLGMVRERINISILDSMGGSAIDYHRSKLFATMTFRYFYRFPIRIPRMKMMVGAEIGGAYHPKFINSNPYTVFNDTSYTLSTSLLNSHDFLLILGISGRMDIKLFKNLTLTLVATLIGSPMRGTEYGLNYTIPGMSNQTAQDYGSVLNINLNAGLKFDFFSHKKKKATYIKYGIPDPFRDDQE